MTNSTGRSPEAASVFDKYADRYHEKFKGYAPYLASYEGFAELVTKWDKTSGRVLDVACGSGIFSQFLRERFPLLTVTGVDLAPAMVELAGKYDPLGKYSVMDCRDIGKLEERFDLILLGFCLPYLSKKEAVRILSDATRLLEPGGLLYLSTMAGDYEQSGYQTSGSENEDRIYIYYHDPLFLNELFSRNGLEILDQQSRPYKNSDGTTVDDLFLMARKGQ